MSFKVGDRVERSRWLGDGKRESKRIGTIEYVYTSVPSHTKETITLYAIRWDDSGLLERGYQDLGLRFALEE